MPCRCYEMLIDEERRITYTSFVCHVWNWLTFDKVGLATFAFNMYKSSNDGEELSKDDLMKVLEGNYDLHVVLRHCRVMKGSKRPRYCHSPPLTSTS